ncbi:GNAT family N-acetyltransferase [Actinoplanes sp. NPDC051861]|uniref:GNAT family N-acetyltransferase n=1 Tax=Actinoplanes sp. NPDC051861 TaxID=3155170 RepID=UPI00343A05AA
MPERLRSLEERDWPAISSLEKSTYAGKGLSEDLTVLRSRAHPSTSFVLDVDGRVGGYLLALPYPRWQVPDLLVPSAFGSGPDLHLHDLVIAPEFRGLGWGRRLVDSAREFAHVSLVSVDGSEGFWAACGFRAHPEIDVPGYGKGAVYMSRDLHLPAMRSA